MSAAAYDPNGYFQTLPLDLLVAAAQGEVDLNLLARQTLAGRGLSPEGLWVGMKKAAELAGVSA